MRKGNCLEFSNEDLYSNYAVYGISCFISLPRLVFLLEKVFNMTFQRHPYNAIEPNSSIEFARFDHILNLELDAGIEVFTNISNVNIFLIPELHMFDFLLVFNDIEYEYMLLNQIANLKKNNELQSVVKVKHININHIDRLFSQAPRDKMPKSKELPTQNEIDEESLK